MLHTLDIRDMLIIDRLEVTFQPGLNVLTGETGAGKSILLDSLGFVLGWRGRAELVRKGAAQGEVTAVFHLPPQHPAHALLEKAAMPPAQEGELILRRVNFPDGRKTAWVNDRRVSGDALRQLSAVLVELHGQHDDRGLLNPRGHMALLDDYGDHGRFLEKCRTAWQGFQASDAAVSSARTALEALEKEEEFLRHAVAEFEALSPDAGEEAALDTARRRMQAAEQTEGDVRAAHAALSGDGAEGKMADALRWLEESDTKTEGAFAPAIAALTRAMHELAEAEQALARGRDGLEFDPAELEHCEERLFAIRALARKHEVQPDDLATFGAGLRSRLGELDRGAGDLADLEAARTAARGTWQAAAERLTKARKTAAAGLDRAMQAELAPLKMERAVFSTGVSDTANPGSAGQDEVRFTVATNPGAPPGALEKIASGGELSRFLLALKVCLTRAASGVTMIFDEIDRGVGGATADAVGRRLSTLAAEGQVLVVTHSPQVAARGAHHWRVEKHSTTSETLSRVVALTPEARTDEIARMLAGDQITEEARAAARRLLDG